MLMIALTSLALAQEPPPPPIVGGETTTDFSPVGALLAVYGNSGSDFCSGTLATRDWVVTAAHCIEAAVTYDRQGYDIYFCTGSNIYSNSGIDECDVAVDMIPHPNYNASTLVHDIGVVELSSGLRASGSYALNTSRPSTFSTSDVVTYVGWGVTGDNRQDSGRKRTAEVPFLSHGGSIYYDGSFLYTWDPYGEKNICSGDSGGAGLMWDNGDWELVGVNSFGFDLNGGNPNCEGEYAAAGITRIDSHYDFLTTYIDVDAVEEDDDDNNNGGGNNNGNNGNNGNNNNNDDDDDSDDNSDDGGEDLGDTAEPPRNKGNGNGKNDLSAEEMGGCSSVPMKASGLMGLAVLGALIARRRD